MQYPRNGKQSKNHGYFIHIPIEPINNTMIYPWLRRSHRSRPDGDKSCYSHTASLASVLTQFFCVVYCSCSLLGHCRTDKPKMEFQRARLAGGLPTDTARRTLSLRGTRKLSRDGVALELFVSTPGIMTGVSCEGRPRELRTSDICCFVDHGM